MRELSLAELHRITGGEYSDSLPEDIASLSAATGYTIGVFIKSMKGKNSQSSITGMTNAIISCEKTFKLLQQTIIPPSCPELRGIEMVVEFVCGIHAGLFGRAPTS